MGFRHLRYVTVVADELHFSRATERLHIERSPLSQATKIWSTTLAPNSLNVQLAPPISRDVLAQARFFQFPMLLFRGVARLPFPARIGRLPTSQMILPSMLVSLPWNGARVGPTAAVERGYR